MENLVQHAPLVYEMSVSSEGMILLDCLRDLIERIIKKEYEVYIRSSHMSVKP